MNSRSAFYSTCKLLAIFSAFALAGCSGASSSSKVAASASPVFSEMNEKTGSAQIADSWVHCANENETCAFTGTQTVRYGANGTYVSATFSNGVSCSNSVFGDPISGVVKSCDVLQTAQPAGAWAHCANENETCAFTGTQTVRYGANGTYVSATFSNGVSCSNSVFGDPISGVVKSCDVLQTVQPAGAWVHCANENQTCAFTGTQTVRYGANGTYASGSYSNGVSCSNSVFGDPISGIVKSCDLFSQAAELDPGVFDAQFYISRYSDLAQLTPAQAQAHWLTTGVTEGRQGSSLFWSQEYLALNSGVATSVGSTNYDGALQNYVSYGRGIGRIGVTALSPLVYDYQTYKLLNSDLSSLSAADAQTHWLNHGISEGRRANLIFSASEYFAENPAAVAMLITAPNSAPNSVAGTSNFAAIQSYVLAGAGLNLAGLFITDSDVFNCPFYTQTSSCTPTVATNAKLDWVQSGLSQNRMASPAFSASQYLTRYPDLASAYGATNYQAAAVHFAQHGKKDGRSGLISLSSNAAYQQIAPSITSPVTAVAGDRVQSFVAPDGRTVTVVVKAPANASGPALVAPALAAGGDAYAYFKSWIQTATQQHAASLTFPKANYSVTPPASAAHISFGTLADAVVDFSGSSLTFNALTSGLQLTSNQRLIVRNATIEFSQPIAATAKVVSGGGTTKALQVDDAYPVPAGAQVRSVSLFDSVNKKWVQSPSVELFPKSPFPTVNGQTISSADFGILPLGASVLVRYHLYEGAIVYVGGANTQDLAFENITMYQAPGEGFNVYNAGRGFRISNCHILVNPNDPSRLISLATDAAHFTSSGGDIIIEGNDFASQGDDALNLAATLTSVISSTINSGVQQISFSSAVPLANGERIGLFNSGMGLLGYATVSNVATVNGTTTANLSQAINGVVSTTKITNLDRVNSRYYIVNNQFHDNRARAMLLQAPNGWVQGNKLARQTLSSVNIMADQTSFSEGPGAANLRFTGNTIQSPGSNRLGALGVYVSLQSGVAPEAVEQQIMIDANTITQTPGPAIFVSSAKDVSILNNTIANANQVINSPPIYFGSASGASSIVVTKAQRVTLSGNSRDQGSTSGAISVDTTSTGAVSVQTSY